MDNWLAVVSGRDTAWCGSFTLQKLNQVVRFRDATLPSRHDVIAVVTDYRNIHRLCVPVWLLLRKSNSVSATIYDCYMPTQSNSCYPPASQ